MVKFMNGNFVSVAFVVAESQGPNYSNCLVNTVSDQKYYSDRNVAHDLSSL
jgi:hypothetical protein